MEKGKYKLIDFLRGYSIFTIALMHLVNGTVDGIVLKAFAFGGAGVHVFILCSGFGLYLSYLRKPVRYVDFLKRRFSKVWIPYAIVVLLWGLWLWGTTGSYPLRETSSHLLLYKMFSSELDVSLCNPYWFISTIFQFYIFWPLIVKVYRLNFGIIILFVISLVWSTIVAINGLSEERPWGSFFLQYIWEFGLGMWIADRCSMDEKKGKSLMEICNYNWYLLIVGAIGGMSLSAFMAWNGGILKLYNDIPSLMGYLSVALILYKLGINMVNRFFEWANRFSYELYLIHMLVYSILNYYSEINIALRLVLSFVAAYVLAYSYRLMMTKIKFVK